MHSVQQVVGNCVLSNCMNCVVIKRLQDHSRKKKKISSKTKFRFHCPQSSFVLNKKLKYSQGHPNKLFRFKSPDRPIFCRYSEKKDKFFCQRSKNDHVLLTTIDMMRYPCLYQHRYYVFLKLFRRLIVVLIYIIIWQTQS